jgi:hypothetical protein
MSGGGMGWIEYHTALRDHWKIKRLADILEVEYTTALGSISCLWLWCAEYAPTGDLRRFTDEEIRFAARNTSSKFTFGSLKACGLLTEGKFINDWGQHGLKLLQSKRKANREYARRQRKSGYPLDNERVAIPNQPYHTNLTNKYKHLSDPIFLKTFEDYLEMRKKIRRPATERAQEIALTICHKHDLKTATAMLEQSILGSWQGVFPLKTGFEKKDTQQTQVRKEPKANPACSNCKGTGSFRLENGKTSQCWCVS